MRSRGVPASDIDDVTSETFERVLRYAPTFETADELWPWVAKVAKQRWIDALRKRPDTFTFEGEYDVVADDVASAGEARVVWSRLVERFPELRTTDQDVLRQAIDGELRYATKMEGQRQRVRLHRARNRLREMLDGLAAVVGLIGIRLRAWLEEAPTAVPPLAAVFVIVITSGLPVTQRNRASTIGVQREDQPPAAVAPEPKVDERYVAGGGLASDPSVEQTEGRSVSTQTSTVHESRVPAVVVTVPTPAGQGHYRTRPDQEGDHLACVTAGPLGTTCADVGLPSGPPSP